jgi:hypothetical protein
VLVKVRWLLMVLPFVLWGTAMAAMKPLLVDAGPLTLAWMRLLPAGCVLLLAGWFWRSTWRVDRRDWLWLALFALVDATAFQALLARGLDHHPHTLIAEPMLFALEQDRARQSALLSCPSSLPFASYTGGSTTNVATRPKTRRPPRWIPQIGTTCAQTRMRCLMLPSIR